MKKADGIFWGDVHLREKIPIARTDDALEAQWKKVKFVSDLQKEHDCPIFCTGDLFDHWKASPELISKAIEFLPDQMYNIYGDHELPNHSFEMRHKSALTTLEKAGKVTILNAGHGNKKSSSKIRKGSVPFVIKKRKLFVWHVLTWKSELPFPGCENKAAKKLLKKYPQFDVIATGDNHKPFIEKYKGRILVNTGSMMRNNADQIDYKPAVWLYYADTNTVKPVYLPIEKDVISREHIDIKNERNERIEAFVSSVDTKIDVSMSFDKNLKSIIQKNKVKGKVKQIIDKHLEQ